MRRFWRLPILCAVAAVLVVALIDWSIIPINEAGRHQGSTAWLAGLARVLEVPSFLAARKLKIRLPGRPELMPWCILMACNVPLYLIGAVVVRWMWKAGTIGSTDAWGYPGAMGKRTRLPVLSRMRSRLHRQASTLAHGTQQTISTDSTDKEVQVSSAVTKWRPGRVSAVKHQGRHLPTRRQFLAAGNRLAFTGAAAAFGYAFAIERERFLVKRYAVPIVGLPASLHGLRIVQLTDIHHGPWTSLAYVRRIVAAANTLGADLIALTGDYVLYSSSYVRPVAQELAGLRANIGVLGVCGNHDWFDAGPVTQSEFRRAGLRLIDNSRMYITPDRRLSRAAPRDGLCVAGLADLWGAHPDYSKALGGVAPEMPRLLLSHNPDTAELRAAGGHRVDLMISGHTHGGQIHIPGIGSPFVPSNYGQKYVYGLVQGPAFRVLVSSGLGTNVVPIRFCRPPEITVITLECGA